MPHPQIAAIIGKFGPGEPGPEIFEAVALGHGLKCLPTRRAGDGFSLVPRDLLVRLEQYPELGASRAVILYCLESGHTQVLDFIEQLHRRRPHAEVLIYADEAHDSGVLAMNCLKSAHGVGVHGYLVRGRSTLPAIRTHVMQLFSNSPAYPPFRDVRRVGRLQQAFIATPYHEIALTDYYNAIAPALDALGMKPVLGRDELTSTSLLQQVQENIEASQLVIVNLSEYHGFGPSPNCYFELGYALGRRMPVVLVQREGAGTVATNLAGAQLVRYTTCSELSMRLYAGLK